MNGSTVLIIPSFRESPQYQDMVSRGWYLVDDPDYPRMVIFQRNQHEF